VPTHAVRNDYGKEFTLKDFGGKFLVALFWSKSCAPCLKEMGALAEFQEKTKNDGIKLIIISPEREWDSVEQRQKLLNRTGGGSLESYVDVKGSLAESFGIFSNPNTVLVNAKGYEIGRIRGAADWADQDVIRYIYELKAVHNHTEPPKQDLSVKPIKVRDI
jgi:thiol-disulfide isomerase/thioredoxin